MESTSGSPRFKGTIFQVWKGNRPCLVYVTEEQVYFIRRAVGINAGAAAVVSSQFGLLGGLAVGLAGAAQAKGAASFVRDDDYTPPDQLVSRHPENYTIPVADLIDSRIEPAGKYMSYGKNAGRWHFTRRGETKETVVLFDSPADASRAVFLLNPVFGSRLRNEAGICGAATSAPGRSPQSARRDNRGSDLVTTLPLPSGQAEIVKAIQSLTQLLSERAPAEWQKVHCQVRLSSAETGRPLEIVIGHSDRADELCPTEDPTIHHAAMRLTRELTSSVSTFPGLVIEMTRIDQGSWRNNVKLMDRR